MGFNPSKNLVRTCIALLLLSIFASTFMNVGFAAVQVNVTLNSNKVIATNRLEVGVYIGSQDTGKFQDSSSFRGLAKDANIKFVAFMENRLWAVPHPCTHFPDRWNWQGMDELIREILDIGAEPLVVLGFCYRDGVWVPAGMAGRSTAGYAKPTAEEWGTYCAEWAKHFKQAGLPVRYFDIMHEAHQYYGWQRSLDVNKMNYVISLFNSAATKMRQQNPNILISNDDAMMDWVMPYYISKAEDLDFLCWHRYLTGSKSESDSSLIRKAEFDEGGDKGPDNFIDPARQKYYNSKGVLLPVIQSGGNMNYAYSSGTDPRLQTMTGATCLALSLKLLMLKGVEYNDVYTFGGSGSENFGMVNVDTANPYYPYYVYRMVGPNSGKGDSIIQSSSSSSDISTIAWLHGGKLKVLLINKVTGQRDVALSGVEGEITFQKIDNTASGLQTGTVSANKVISMNGYSVVLLQTENSQSPSTPPSTPPPTLPPTPPPTTSVFEDGFESGSFGAWTGRSLSPDESASVVTTRSHDGTYGAMFASNGGGQTEYAYCYKAVGSSSELYARCYFYISKSGFAKSGIAENDDASYYFVVLAAESNNVAYAGWRKTGGVVKWTLLIKSGTTNVIAYSTTSPFLSRWYSVELHWKKDATKGLGELWVDGVKVCAITGENTASYGDVNQVRFGLPAIYNCGSTTAYCDCAKIAQSYIGPES